jgi:hypothetical protein
VLPNPEAITAFKDACGVSMSCRRRSSSAMAGPHRRRKTRPERKGGRGKQSKCRKPNAKRWPLKSSTC